jgi:hypothetical protein
VWVLIGQADRLLASSGRPQTSVGHYRRVWAAFGRFCDREGIVEPVPDHIAMFLIDDGADVNALTAWQQFKRRAVTCLFAIDETGAFPGPVGTKKLGVPAQFASELGAYEQWLAGRRLASCTVSKKRWALVRFLRFLDGAGVPALAALRATDV